MVHELYMDVVDLAEEIVKFSGHLVENYGIQLANTSDTNESNIHQRCYHDWVYFCFAKVSRSLYASVYLVQDYYRMDVFLILRSAYELCLKLSNTLNDPKRIQEYVFQDTGLVHGTYEYSKRKGKPCYKEVVYLKTGEKYPHGTSVGKISKNTLHKNDGKLHSKIYRYFSEYMHSNMISSGNFLTHDRLRYTVDPKNLYFETPFFILYIEFMVLEAYEYYHTYNHKWNIIKIKQEELNELQNLKQNCSNRLLDLVDLIDFSQFGEEFKKLFVERVTTNYGERL